MVDFGVNGGFMGHAMLALASPEAVPATSDLARKLADLWPVGARQLWKVRTVECCRAQPGLYRSEALLHLDDAGLLVLFGEVAPCGSISLVDGESVEVWQVPKLLRARFCEAIMDDVLLDMAALEANWSLGTALRAVFQPAGLEREPTSELLAHAKSCWEAAPICTTVPIVFWQRYLCRIAKGSDTASAALIRQWMPLAADRSLPGDLVTALRDRGWTRAIFSCTIVTC